MRVYLDFSFHLLQAVLKHLVPALGGVKLLSQLPGHLLQPVHFTFLCHTHLQNGEHE